MTKSATTAGERALGAAIVAAIFAAVGAGMGTVMWGFDVNQTGATFIVLWLLIFIVLASGWSDKELPPPGKKKAPTVADHTSVGRSSPPSAPSPTVKTTSATAPAPSSGTAQAAAPAPKAAPASASAASAASAAEADTEGTKPATLDAPRSGGADDLKQIKGVGPALEKLCNSLGFYHFDQIAKWTPTEVAWVDQNLEGFKGRVSRDNWVEQAKVLAAGGETEFSKKVEKGDVY